MARYFRVLSIDGGGIRGIIPARLLVEFEERAGKPICDLFDLIVGTSTGGILALGLTVPSPADRTRPRFRAAHLLEFYSQEGEAIFPPPRGWSRFTNPPSLLRRAKYDAGSLEHALKRRFSDGEGQDVMLSQALNRVLVPFYDFEKARPLTFDSGAAEFPGNSDLPMWRVARAASAAPTYFAPHRIEGLKGGAVTAIDGGIFANNPATLGYLEAELAVRAMLDPQEIVLISLGSGDIVTGAPYEVVRNWRWIEYARHLVPIVLDATSNVYEDEIRGLLHLNLPPNSQRYWRLQTKLDREHTRLDDASPENVRRLRYEYAEDLVRLHISEIERIVQVLSE